LFRFIVFDNPQPDLQNLIPFEQRWALLLHNISLNSILIIIAAQLQCLGRNHITKYINYILHYQGEGAVLRKPYSLYTQGRTDSILKLKRQKDAEALVIAEDIVDYALNQDAKLYICELANGIIFKSPVNTKAILISHITPIISTTTTMTTTMIKHNGLPKIGDVVSFTYSSSKFGSPQNPLIYRIRKDLLWEDVLATSDSQPFSLPLISSSFSTTLFSNNTPFFYSTYTSLPSVIGNSRFVSAVLNKSSQSLLGGVQQEGSHSSNNNSNNSDSDNRHTHGYWSKYDSINIRKFFDNFAQSRKFDPLKASSWYNINYTDIVAAGGGSIRSHFSQSFYKSILAAYPEIAEIAKTFIQREDSKTDSAKYLLYLCTRLEKIKNKI